MSIAFSFFIVGELRLHKPFYTLFRAHAVGEDPTGLTDMSRFESLTQRHEWFDFVHRDLPRKQAGKQAEEQDTQQDTQPSPENARQALDATSTELPSDTCNTSEPAPQTAPAPAPNRHTFANDSKIQCGNSEGDAGWPGNGEPGATPAPDLPFRPYKGRLRHWYMVGLQAWQLRVGSFLRDVSNTADILQDWRFMLPWLTACIQNFQSPNISWNADPSQQQPYQARHPAT